MNVKYLSDCLNDCGFKEAKIEKFINLIGTDDLDECLRLLYSQRNLLMDRLHSAQHQVDTLDYLIKNIRSGGQAL